VAQYLPARFATLEDLFDTYTEMLRPISPKMFSAFVTTIILPPLEQSALLINLLFPFLAVAPKHINIFEATQADLVKYFFPHPANLTSLSDNYKMALVVQILLMTLRERNVLDVKDGQLRKAVEKGNEARKKKATGDARTKGKGKNTIEKNAKDMLELTTTFIAIILDMLEMDAGMTPTSFPTLSDDDESELSSQLSSSQLSDAARDMESDDEDENEEDEGIDVDEDMESDSGESDGDTIVVRP
jgi:hypothetical protein